MLRPLSEWHIASHGSSVVGELQVLPHSRHTCILAAWRREKSLKHAPGRTRPALPLRCLAEARDTHPSARREMPRSESKLQGQRRSSQAAKDDDWIDAREVHPSARRTLPHNESDAQEEAGNNQCARQPGGTQNRLQTQRWLWRSPAGAIQQLSMPKLVLYCSSQASFIDSTWLAAPP